jgi:hypothetical protein
MAKNTLSLDLFTVNLVVSSENVTTNVNAVINQIKPLSNPRAILNALESINGVISLEIIENSTGDVVLSSSPLTE